MKGSLDSAFKLELKNLLIQECMIHDITADDIADDAILFGSESPVGLDSIDALQISLAIQKRFDINITDSKVLRSAFATISSMADFIRPE